MVQIHPHRVVVPGFFSSRREEKSIPEDNVVFWKSHYSPDITSFTLLASMKKRGGLFLFYELFIIIHRDIINRDEKLLE